MSYYQLKIKKLKRNLPIIALSPKIRIASVNLLGDTRLVEVMAKQLYQKVCNLGFDYLVGPEVKVLPLLHELSKMLKKERYVVCRKSIHGYMLFPVSTKRKPGLVVNGVDAKLLRGKKVLVIDDVVSSGKTMEVMEELMEIVGAKIVAKAALFKQGEDKRGELEDLIYVARLPLFTS